MKSFGQGSSSPWLKVAHFALPHAPLEIIDTGQIYFAGERHVEGAIASVHGAMRWGQNADHVHQNYYRHLLQAQFADSIIARALQRLEQSGELERTTIVVTADHGISYFPRSYRRETTAENYVFQAGVPLFVKQPNQQSGSTVNDPALSVDIVPTVVNQFGLNVQNADGVDLAQVGGSAPRSTFKHACIDVSAGSAGIGYREYRSDLLPGLIAEAQRAHSLFGGGRRPRPLFSRYSNWLGQSPQDIAASAQPDGDTVVFFPRLQLWDQLDPSAEWLPIHIDGRFMPSVDEGAGAAPIIAVVVNDKIAGIMPVLKKGTEYLLSTMIEPQSLVKGKNQVSFYRIVEGPSGPSLKLLKLLYR